MADQSKLMKKWEEIENDSPEQRRLYLDGKLKREPVDLYSAIKEGDHLVAKGGMDSMISYFHHFLCSGSDSEGPIIIHYYNSEKKQSPVKVASTCYFSSGSSLLKKGEIQEVSLRSYIKEEELKEKMVQRVVWPSKLRRFTSEEVVERARKRIGEKCYDLTENNCESFVMWCLCDLNISLQVTPGRKTTHEVGSTVLWKMLSQIPKIGVDICRVLARILEGIHVAVPEVLKTAALGCLGDVIGVVLIVIYEAVSCTKEIQEKYKDWLGPKALIKSKKDFFRKVADRVFLAIFRLGGSIGGVLAGQPVATFCLASLGVSSPMAFILCSTLAGLVGAMLGALVGQQILAKTFSATNAMDQIRSLKSINESLKSMIEEVKVQFPNKPFIQTLSIYL